MRVTIGQINTINGDFESNTAAIIRAIEQAKRENSNLVVLPEMCIQGYTSLDWFLDRDVERCALQPLEKIIEATEGITAMVGTVRPSNLTTGRRLYQLRRRHSQSEIGRLCRQDSAARVRRLRRSSLLPTRPNAICSRLEKKTRRRSLRRLLERQNFLARTTLLARSGRRTDRDRRRSAGLNQRLAFQ